MSDSGLNPESPLLYKAGESLLNFDESCSPSRYLIAVSSLVTSHLVYMFLKKEKKKNINLSFHFPLLDT